MASPDPPFETFVDRLRAGDPDAAGQVFARYARRLLGLASTRLGRLLRPKVYRVLWDLQQEQLEPPDPWVIVGLLVSRLLSSQRPDWWYWRCASHLLGPVVAIAKLAGVRTIFSVCFDSDVNIRHALFRRSRWWQVYHLL